MAISKVATVRKDGSVSLKVVITDMARALDIKAGEQVKVTIAKIEEGLQ